MFDFYQRLWPNPKPDGPNGDIIVQTWARRSKQERSNRARRFYQLHGYEPYRTEKSYWRCSISRLFTTALFPDNTFLWEHLIRGVGNRRTSLVATRDAVALIGFRPGNRGRCRPSSLDVASPRSGHDIHDNWKLWNSLLLKISTFKSICRYFSFLSFIFFFLNV